ncbi:molybdate ABC transporter substrate-binding protein [Scytonema sp. NUACC21]
MKPNLAVSLLSAIAILSLALFGCGKQEIVKIGLTVSAGQSLKPAMMEIQELYSQQKPFVTITYNFGSGGSLKKAIEQGKNVDIFLTGGADFLNDLQSQNFLLTNTYKKLLTNKIVLITQKKTRGISNFNNLSGKQVKTVALSDFKTGASGRYAREVLTSLKILDKVKPKLVFTKTSTEVPSLLEEGKVDAGIVYATDAIGENQIKIVAIAPENSHSPINYNVAVLKTSPHIPEAQEFIQFLQSEQASAVFVKYGFAIADNDRGRK